MDLASISGAVSALKTSVDMVKTAIGLHDDMKLAEATRLLNDKIMDVQNAALSLQEKLSNQRDEIDELKDAKREALKKVDALEKQKSKREQYELVELTPGNFVLSWIGDSSTLPHHVCQRCMDNESKISILQTRFEVFRMVCYCSMCSTSYGEPAPQV